MWKFLHKLASPPHFYELAARIIPWFAGSALVLLAYGTVAGLFIAPADYQQGDAFRIIYVHVPAAYLSTFGVDRSVQGRGLGRVLLADALRRVAIVSEQMGIAAVVLDVLDDGDGEAVDKRVRFYERFGFTAFPSQPMRMFLPIKTVRSMLEATKS